jgi:tetratricopeptide (TPR) repeat protein
MQPPVSAALEAGEQAELRADYLDAAAIYRTMLADPDPLVGAEAQFRLGRVAWRQGNYVTALESFELARSIAARLGDRELQASAEIGIGNVCYAHAEYVKARTSYNAALGQTANERLHGMVLLNLGVIANIEGQLDEACSHYLQSRAAFHRAGDSNGEAQAHHNLGMLHADRLEWDAADQAYARCLELSEITGNREMIGLVWMNRSELSCSMGRYEEAVTRCDQALGIFAEIGAEVHRGTTLRWKGRALRELHRYVASERALGEAVRIAHRAQAKLLEAESMQELACTATLAGDPAFARVWYQRALELFVMAGAQREADEIRADLRALDDL